MKIGKPTIIGLWLFLVGMAGVLGSGVMYFVNTSIKLSGTTIPIDDALCLMFAISFFVGLFMIKPWR